MLLLCCQDRPKVYSQYTCLRLACQLRKVKALLEQKGRHSSIPQRASLPPAARTPLTNRPIADDLLEEDERYYPVRPASSAIRYTTTRDQVIQQGNKRIIVHHGLPPGRQPPPQPEPVTTQRKHWLFWLGCIFCIMLFLFS